jgi:ketosteroid isomerase-like protein
MKASMHPRNIARCLLALALGSSASGLHAQDEEKLHAELRNLNVAYENAINSGDLSALAPIFTPETSGVVVDNQVFKTLADLKEIYTRFHAEFPGTTYHITMDPDRSQIYGNIAVAHGRCQETVTMPAGSFAYTSTWTAVLRRDEGKWTLIRSQVTMDPFDSSIVKHLIHKAETYSGLAGAVIGLLLGLSVALLLPRKPSPAA